MNKYFISYFFKTEIGTYGLGRTIFDSDGEITEGTDIVRIEDRISKMEDLKEVSILNFIKM